MNPHRISILLGFALLFLAPFGDAAERESFAPKPEDHQLPKAMRSEMTDLPVVRVGTREGDILGADNRAIQAAVDYVAGLGGGTVEIAEGVYLMRDSLHLRSHVTIRGQAEKTVLVKSPGVSSSLALDGDAGEEQITVVKPDAFRPGDGVSILDDKSGGFMITVARITGRKGNTFSISAPLSDDYVVSRNARLVSMFPVISGHNIEGARVQSLVVDGARGKNARIDGCVGGGIYLYRAFGTVLENCHVRDYNGDGISFQQSNDVQLVGCVSERNATFGLHPGSGSQRALIRNCTVRANEGDGIFLCYRVRHAVFESNEVSANRGHGICIGHKDSDNLFRKNVIRGNGRYGIVFRNELEGVAGHRNRIEENRIEDNGHRVGNAGIYITGETNGVVIRGNVIRDTRPPGSRTQRTAIRLGEKSGETAIEKNEIIADQEIEDQRQSRTAAK